MSLTITTTQPPEAVSHFMYIYLPDLLYKLFVYYTDANKLKYIDSEFNINSMFILNKAFKNLSVGRIGTD